MILDTNIVSYMMRGGSVAERYAPRLQGRLLYITFVTIGEMYYGAERNEWGPRRRAALAAYIGRFTVLPYNPEVAGATAQSAPPERAAARAWKPTTPG